MSPQQNSFFGIKASKPGLNVNGASDNQLVYKNDFSTTTFYDTSSARIVEGLLPDGTYGMWVSKPGVDVTDPASALNGGLIFNSNQDIFKIVLTGKISVSVPDPFTPGGDVITAVVPHGLGIIPASLVFVALPLSVTYPTYLAGQITPLPWHLVSAGTGGGTTVTPMTITTRADSTNLYIDTINNFSSGLTGVGGTYSFTYYILQETAAAA